MGRLNVLQACTEPMHTCTSTAPMGMTQRFGSAAEADGETETSAADVDTTRGFYPRGARSWLFVVGRYD